MPPASTEKILRAHLREHNLSVVAASGLLLFFSAIGWAVCYGVARFLAALFVVFQKGHTTSGYYVVEHERLVHVPTAAPYLPASFHMICWIVLAVLLVLAALDAWFFPEERVVDDRPALETIADIAFFLPRLTISVFLNFGVWAHLRRRDRQPGAALLDRLRTRRKISLQELPQDLPDERQRNRLLRILQTTQLVEVRMERSLAWLRLSWKAPAALRQTMLEAPEEPMQQARGRVVEPETFAEMKRALPAPRRTEEA